MKELRTGSLCLLLLLSGTLSAGSFERFLLPRTGPSPVVDIAGGETSAWVTDGSAIAKVTPAGLEELFAPPTFPVDQVVIDPLDGSAWFANGHQFGHLTHGGQGTAWWLPTSAISYDSTDMIFDAAGNLWIALGLRHVVRVTRSLDVTVFSPEADVFYPELLAEGADGNIWISSPSHKFARLTPEGTFTVFEVPVADWFTGLAAGPDGNLWLTSGLWKLRRATTSGAVNEVPLTEVTSGPLVAGDDGYLWWLAPNLSEVRKYAIGTSASSAGFPLPAGETVVAMSASAAGIWWGTYEGSLGLLSYAGETEQWPFAVRGPAARSMTSTATHVWFTAPSENLIGRTDANGVTTLFPLPHSGSDPFGIVAVGDVVWFTEAAGNRIGRITAGGTIEEFDVPSAGGQPTAITRGPDGNVWFTLSAVDKIGRITPAGTITEFPLPAPTRSPNSIATGADGNLWFTSHEAHMVSRMTTSGAVTDYWAGGNFPRAIVAAPDGNLWFANSTGSPQRITPEGDRTTARGYLNAESTVIGPDGAIWGNDGVSLSRLTLDGVSHTWSPANGWTGFAITVGPDGKIWFDERATQSLYRVTPDQPIAGSAHTACYDSNAEIGGLVGTFVDPVATRDVTDYAATVKVNETVPGVITAAGAGTFHVTGAGWGDPDVAADVEVTFTSKPGPGVIGQTVIVRARVEPTQVSADRKTFPLDGGDGSLYVTMSGGCSWTARTFTSWITLPSTTSGNGTGSLAFHVAPNPTSLQRSGSIVVNNVTIPITQEGAPPQSSTFNLVTPCRLVDSRNSQPVGPTSTLTVAVGNRCGIPAAAAAIVANVTVVNPPTSGWLSLYPAFSQWPGTSMISFRPGKTRANNAIIPLASEGLTVRNGSEAPIDFLIDVTGYFQAPPTPNP